MQLLEQIKNNIQLNIASAYLQILYNNEQVYTTKDQIENTKLQAERTALLIEAGKLPNGDLLEIQAQLAQEELRLVNNENALEKGSINEVSGLTTRTSSVSWIKNRNTCQKVFSVMKKQAEQFSSLHLDNIEPLQYSEYGNNQEYGWHQDVNNTPYPDGRIRKISFSIFLILQNLTIKFL